MDKIFGGMAGKAEGKLRSRQTQIENAIDAAAGSTHAHEMVSTAPSGTKVHMSNEAGDYSFQTTDKMRERSAQKAASKSVQDWIESGR